MTTYAAVQDAEPQSFAQATGLLQSTLRRDRQIRLVKTLLYGLGGAGAGFGLATIMGATPQFYWGIGGFALGGGLGALCLWTAAPRLIDIARRADRHLGSDAAIETAVEGWVKNAPQNDVTRLLQNRVAQRMAGLNVAALAPLTPFRPLLAAVAGLAIALGAAFVQPQMPGLAADSGLAAQDSALTESLTALAALRDSDDTALAALAQEAEALLAALAQGEDPETLAEGLAALQAETARILQQDPDAAVETAALEDALQQLTARATGAEEAPAPDEAVALSDDDPGWGNMDDMQTQNIDAPQNDMVTMATRSDESAIEDNTLACEFGDEATCSVRADGEPPAVQNQYDEDVPEQIGRDELTAGGEPTTSRSGTGDAGATGTAEAALYGTAQVLPPLEAAFNADTLTLSAANPMGEGQRAQGDQTTTFEGGPVTRFPDAPEIGQADWQRVVEQPVTRSLINPVMGQAMRAYHTAPEDWR